jgi:hypothetical protein
VEILNAKQPRCVLPLNDLLQFNEQWEAGQMTRAAGATGGNQGGTGSTYSETNRY